MSSQRDLKRHALAARLGNEFLDVQPYGIGDVLPVGSEFERREAIRQATLIGDVFVPLAVAIVSGVFGGALVGIVIGGIQAGAIGGLAIAALCWAILAVDHNRQIWKTERLLGMDIDGDRQVGVPEIRRVTVEVIGEGGKRWRIGDLPVSEVTAVKVAKALRDGVGFSRSSLNGAGACSQDEYRRLSHWMIGKGLAIRARDNSTQPTAAGRRLMAVLLE